MSVAKGIEQAHLMQAGWIGHTHHLSNSHHTQSLWGTWCFILNWIWVLKSCIFFLSLAGKYFSGFDQIELCSFVQCSC